jgi:hypothetical protein
MQDSSIPSLDCLSFETSLAEEMNLKSSYKSLDLDVRLILNTSRFDLEPSLESNTARFVLEPSQIDSNMAR